MKTMNIAVIGAAGWIGGLHSDCWGRAKSMTSEVKLNLHTAVDVNAEAVKKVAERYSYEHWSTNYDDVIENPEVDLIDIACSNDFHKDIAMKAAAKGKYIFCEKPLAMNYADAREMVDAVNKNNICNRVDFMFRKYPSLVFVRQMLDRGDIGEIRHLRILLEQDFYSDPNSPYDWHFNMKTSGGGSIVTFGTHIIDLARYFVGDFDEVSAHATTCIPERPLVKGGTEMGKVDVDDMMMVLIKFKTGATGVLFTSWVTHGRKNHLEFQLAGSKATVLFNSERMNEIELYEATGEPDKRGFKTILIGTPHPYGDLFSQKTGMGIGVKESYTIQMMDYLKDIVHGTVSGPVFEDGLENVLCVEKIQESARTGKWVKVKP